VTKESEYEDDFAKILSLHLAAKIAIIWDLIENQSCVSETQKDKPKVKPKVKVKQKKDEPSKDQKVVKKEVVQKTEAPRAQVP